MRNGMIKMIKLEFRVFLDKFSKFLGRILQKYDICKIIIESVLTTSHVASKGTILLELLSLM